jgi:hypothetical protein
MADPAGEWRKGCNSLNSNPAAAQLKAYLSKSRMKLLVKLQPNCMLAAAGLQQQLNSPDSRPLR